MSILRNWFNEVMNGNILEGLPGGEFNIDSAERLLADLETLDDAELSLHVEDIGAMIQSLRQEQRNGFDAPNIRTAIARLNQLHEKAREE